MIVADIAVTLATVALLVGIYLMILKPTVQITKDTRIDQVCPDRWAYNAKTKKCEPRYKTSCMEFSPTDPNLQNYVSQCEFAAQCGTNWAGMCQ